MNNTDTETHARQHKATETMNSRRCSGYPWNATEGACSGLSILIFSSLLFITNVLSAFYKKYYIYCFLFLGLTITSIMYHYNKNSYSSVIDKVFVLAVVLYGGYMLYVKTAYHTHTHTHIMSGVILLTFFSCLILFCYGYLVNDYCYHPDKNVGNMFHGILHIISSLGHHLIIFL
jgi:aminopeptidase-like protein